MIENRSDIIERVGEVCAVIAMSALVYALWIATP